MGSIAVQINHVLDQVRASAAKVNRDSAEITVVAVTKTVPVARIEEAVEAGLKVLGENRVQELTAKYPDLPGVEWHMIGHLQSNKVKYIVDKISLLHSLDSIALAEEIDKRLTRLGRPMDVLVQVNIADESTKSGIKPAETEHFIDKIRCLPGIKVRGLMTIGPYAAGEQEIRGVFRHLRLLAERVKALDFPEVEMKHLSMGMSNDYKIAVEEGATLVRLGSTIFGQRN
ncbi:MAG: YggS family pyridoxal phosphate-dependent enzyme [Thermincola sp.]|jgi:pyridoxal phosphate enzyme (YggS family)|nr:YggS family pyridoxal phosphate-dependent enzyme [Thermincola sp.]MDT3704072.1 YggS family pyridoxal phosphate-dependent enzyme [Thermincola sp.]